MADGSARDLLFDGRGLDLLQEIFDGLIAVTKTAQLQSVILVVPRPGCLENLLLTLGPVKAEESAIVPEAMATIIRLLTRRDTGLPARVVEDAIITNCRNSRLFLVHVLVPRTATSTPSLDTTGLLGQFLIRNPFEDIVV